MTKRYTVAITSETHAALTKIASDEGRTLAAQITRMVADDWKARYPYEPLGAAPSLLPQGNRSKPKPTPEDDDLDDDLDAILDGM